MASVVIGVDGSEGADRALRYGIEEAKRRGWPVKAVYVWQLPHTVEQLGPVVRVDPGDFERAGMEVLDGAIERLGATNGVPVERRLAHGQPAEGLIETAGDDDVLVVGSRGLGGFAGLLLGSVSQECARHAHCPVIIVRDEHS
jgi:nucleotide-binding universal stress UspA family protein